MELQKEKNRIFAVDNSGKLVAEITFPDAGNGLVDHKGDTGIDACLEQVKGEDNGQKHGVYSCGSTKRRQY